MSPKEGSVNIHLLPLHVVLFAVLIPLYMCAGVSLFSNLSDVIGGEKKAA